MELTEKQKYWKSHLEAAASFEGPLTDYAKLHGLDVKKLYVFKGVIREKLEGNSNSSSFVQVTTQQSVRREVYRDRGVGVLLPNGVKLSLPSLDQPGLLERLSRL